MRKVLLVLMVLLTIFSIVSCEPTHKHTCELVVVIEANCGYNGTGYMYCTECAEIVNTITIPATNNHTVIVVSAKEATCTETGLTEGKYCSTCNKVLVEQEVIPAGHSFTSWEIIKKATDIEEGLKERYCNVCKQTESVVIAKLIPSQGLDFALNDDGKSYSVVGIGTCTDTDIVIPTMYKNLPVTSIGYCAFLNCSSLTSIVIPDSVTSIGYFAFFDCTSLASIVIPDSVTSIGDDAFYGCTSLTSIEVDDNNEYYCSIDGNLYNKDATILIQYAIGKTDTSFTIPDSVTWIGNVAFMYCSSLTSIVIPDSVTSIGDDAFYGCTSLTNVVIPDSVTSIGDWAFFDCTSLTSIEIYESNEYYKSIDGNLYSKDGKTLIQYAIGKEDTSFTIPDHVTSIGDWAFFDCTSLASVVIPDSVTRIGGSAFAYCSLLTSAEIGDSVTSIGDCAFCDCISLANVVIPDSMTSIDEYAFLNCSSLTSIVIPDSVTSIGCGVFQNCDSLTIYCEVESKLDGWDSSWNNSDRPVVWGYKSE